jgi:nonspecific dipeptidase
MFHREEATGMNVLLLPIGACDDMAHSQNEKYNISNLVNGIKVGVGLIPTETFVDINALCSFSLTYYKKTRSKVLGIYLHELGKSRGPKPSSCRCVTLTEEELMVPGAFMRGFMCKCEM